MPIVNTHNVTIFEDWVYDGYNNEGSWVTADLSSYVKNLSLIKVYAQVIDYDTDPTEYVTIKIRQCNSNCVINSQCTTSIRYADNQQIGGMECYTDGTCKIDYYIDYGWWEAKKIKIKIVLEYSIG